MMLLYIISCNNSSNAQAQNNNNAVNNQNNSSNITYNEEFKKAPINIQTNADGRIKSRGFAAVSANMDFKYHEFTRHAVGSNDVLIEILYAGYAIAIYICLKGEVLCVYWGFLAHQKCLHL